MKNQLLRRSIYEFIGTYLLLFFGCGAITVSEVAPDAIGHGGICFAWGMAVLVPVYGFGETSGAHINPIVTLGFWSAGRFPASDVGAYIGSQLTGAAAACLTLAALFPGYGYGRTAVSDGIGQAIGLEVIITFFLMFVILKVATGSREIGTQAGISIGGYVGLAAYIAGPITGASMNPARSFGPALAEGNFVNYWVYIVGPVVGSLLAVAVFKLLDRKTVQA